MAAASNGLEVDPSPKKTEENDARTKIWNILFSMKANMDAQLKPYTVLYIVSSIQVKLAFLL